MFLPIIILPNLLTLVAAFGFIFFLLMSWRGTHISGVVRTVEKLLKLMVTERAPQQRYRAIIEYNYQNKTSELISMPSSSVKFSIGEPVRILIADVGKYNLNTLVIKNFPFSLLLACLSGGIVFSWIICLGEVSTQIWVVSIIIALILGAVLACVVFFSGLASKLEERFASNYQTLKRFTNDNELAFARKKLKNYDRNTVIVFLFVASYFCYDSFDFVSTNPDWHNQLRDYILNPLDTITRIESREISAKWVSALKFSAAWFLTAVYCLITLLIKFNRKN